MPNYLVEVVIENKKLAKDPEGETIYRELINKGGYDSIVGVRTGKYLRLSVNAKSKKEAEKLVYQMCNDLRIFNSVVHSCKIAAKGSNI